MKVTILQNLINKNVNYFRSNNVNLYKSYVYDINECIIVKQLHLHSFKKKKN
jgi:hypothetical protein